jgi:hypothetical protein
MSLPSVSKIYAELMQLTEIGGDVFALTAMIDDGWQTMRLKADLKLKFIE